LRLILVSMLFLDQKPGGLISSFSFIFFIPSFPEEGIFKPFHKPLRSWSINKSLKYHKFERIAFSPLISVKMSMKELEQLFAASLPNI